MRRVRRLLALSLVIIAACIILPMTGLIPGSRPPLHGPGPVQQEQDCGRAWAEDDEAGIQLNCDQPVLRSETWDIGGNSYRFNAKNQWKRLHDWCRRVKAEAVLPGEPRVVRPAFTRYYQMSGNDDECEDGAHRFDSYNVIPFGGPHDWEPTGLGYRLSKVIGTPDVYAGSIDSGLVQTDPQVDPTHLELRGTCYAALDTNTVDGGPAFQEFLRCVRRFNAQHGLAAPRGFADAMRAIDRYATWNMLADPEYRPLCVQKFNQCPS
jgi:hypothetical protein